MNRLTKGFVLIAALLISACTAGETPAGSALDSPFASPAPLTSPLAMPTPIPPTPDPSLGHAKGILVVRSNGREVAVRNGLLFLAPTIVASDGKETAVSLDRINSPRAQSDEKGLFHFYNVPPGRYGLVFDLISEAFLLNKPQDGSEFIIVITAGETVDLGKLVYEQFPVTPVP